MSWPLVGREAELARIRACVERGSGMVVLSGPAGVGKTRLAAEALADARRQGRPTIRVTATRSAASVPFGAFAQLLGRSPGSPIGSLDLLHQVRAALLDHARDGQLVLGVDDAHLLDEPSAALLLHIALHDPVKLVLTVRGGDAVPDAVTTLWKDHQALRIDVEPLARPEADRLVEAALGGPVTHPVLHTLWQRAAGNPLFLRELVGGALEDGTLVETDVGWALVGELALSVRLRQVIDERIGRLDRRTRDAVEYVAVADYLGPYWLEWVAGEETLRAALASPLVELERSGRRERLVLAHPLYGEVLTARIPATRYRQMLSRLVETFLEVGSRRKSDSLGYALWHLDSGAPAQPGLLVEGARMALEAGDGALSERLARAACDAGAGFSARLTLGNALALQERTEDAVDSLAEAIEAAASDHEIASATSFRSLGLLRMADLDGALAAAEESQRHVADADAVAMLERLHALLAALGGDLSEAVAVDERQRGNGTECGPLNVGVYARVHQGRFASALEAIREGLSRATNTNDPFSVRHALRGYEVACMTLSGRLAEAEAIARAAYEEASAHRLDLASLWGGYLADVLMFTGRFREVLAVSRETIGLARDRDIFGVAHLCEARWAYAAVELGDLSEARRRLDNASDEVVADPRLTMYWAVVRARLDALDGHVQPAVARIMEAAADAESRGFRMWAVWLYHEVARLDHPHEVVSDIRRLTKGMDGALLPAVATYVAAQADDDTDALERSGREFARMGALGLAVDAFAHAARAHHRAQRPDAAGVLVLQAEELARDCGVVLPPWLRPEAAALTPRECEIALMAAGGLTSREIAERLVVSVRTVDNHLGAVYRKCGLQGREALSHVLLPERVPAT